MSNDPYLTPFLTNSTTTYQGQQNAGQPLSGQQSFESFDAYAVMESAYSNAKKQQGG
jgi:hypothetical protein